MPKRKNTRGSHCAIRGRLERSGNATAAASLTATTVPFASSKLAPASAMHEALDGKGGLGRTPGGHKRRAPGQADAVQLVSTIHTLPMPLSAPQPWVNVLPKMPSHLFSES